MSDPVFTPMAQFLGLGAHSDQDDINSVYLMLDWMAGCKPQIYKYEQWLPLPSYKLIRGEADTGYPG